MKRRKMLFSTFLCACFMLMGACGVKNDEDAFLGHWVGNEMEDGEDFQMDINGDHTMVFSFNGKESEKYSWDFSAGSIKVTADDLTFVAEKEETGILEVSFIINDGSMYKFGCTKVK